MSKQYSTRQAMKQSTSTEEEITIDAGILAAIKVVVREEMGVISARLDNIDKTLVKLVEVQQRLVEVEEGLQFTSERLNSLATEVLPAISNHMAHIAESLAHQTLQIDVHRRKWNIIIHGIEGPAGEIEHATRAKSIQFAQEVLKVEDAASWHLAACHRLSQRANAGIILRFLDLAQRDRWLTGTKNLRGHPRKISISPDLPPILRPLKDNLMLSRSKLAPDIKSKSRVRYLPRWPFVELKVESQAPKQHEESLSGITRQILGFDHIFKIPENT